MKKRPWIWKRTRGSLWEFEGRKEKVELFWLYYNFHVFSHKVEKEKKERNLQGGSLETPYSVASSNMAACGHPYLLISVSQIKVTLGFCNVLPPRTFRWCETADSLVEKKKTKLWLDNVDPVLQLHTIINKVIKDVNSILGTQHPFIYPCRVFMDKMANRI